MGLFSKVKGVVKKPFNAIGIQNLNPFKSKRPNIDFPGQGQDLSKQYLDYLGPGGGKGGAAFTDWMKFLGDSTSGQLSETLGGIDRDTNQSVGSLKMDFADRGLSGPGVGSDIEFNELSRARAYGDRNKTTARNAAATTLSSAYGDKYAADSGTDRLIAQLLQGGANLGATAEEMRQKYKDPSLFDKLLERVNFDLKMGG